MVTAADTVERLDLAAAHHADDVERLERARRAAAVQPLARLTDDRERARADATARASASRDAAAREGLAVHDLPTELERITEQLAALTALLPAEQSLADLREQEATYVEQLSRLADDEQLAAAETTSLTTHVVELEHQLAATDEAAGRVPAAQVAVGELRAVVAAHDDVTRLVAEREVVSAEHAAARTSVVDLREHLLDLRERRIAGMAAELAGGLVVGGDCPVCGSADHPHPALSSAAQPDSRAERAAQRAVDDAQTVELALQLRVRELDASLATARGAVGGSDVAASRTALAEAESTLRAHLEEVAGSDAVRARLASSRARAAELATAAGERRVRTAELTTTLQHVHAQVAELEARVEAARGQHPELRVAADALARRRDLVRAVGSAADALEAAHASHAEASTALLRAVLEAGFDDVDAARAAELAPAAVTELDERVQDHRTTLSAARRVLDEPDAWELLTTPEPDVPALEARRREATEALELCRASEQTAVRTDDRVRRLGGELDAALADWAPLRRQLALATRVASFAEGKAADNRLQMRLSAYVLAHRLSQVVAAANARLATMSDQRYSLEHVGRRGAGESRGGLSLVVRDDWSGESRDPATLSGGETFVVSLALALGLADVVAHEAGGTELETLFVDEGFGALDAETLDDVLDILDTLRENGRTVGVVSHVAEMRDRIPTQLIVRKARTGSTLRVVG